MLLNPFNFQFHKPYYDFEIKGNWIEFFNFQLKTDSDYRIEITLYPKTIFLFLFILKILFNIVDNGNATWNNYLFHHSILSNQNSGQWPQHYPQLLVLKLDQPQQQLEEHPKSLVASRKTYPLQLTNLKQL